MREMDPALRISNLKDLLPLRRAPFHTSPSAACPACNVPNNFSSSFIHGYFP
jgi:hypothetical protein